MASTVSRRERGRRGDNSGGSIGNSRFAKLEYWFLSTAAPRALPSPNGARYVARFDRHNGKYAEISVMVRKATRELDVAEATAGNDDAIRGMAGPDERRT